jgi:hypothetical protein
MDLMKKDMTGVRKHGVIEENFLVYGVGHLTNPARVVIIL